MIKSNIYYRFIRSFGLGIITATALSACSGPQPNKHTGLLGYGTPGVSSYAQGEPATSLREELDRCRGLSRNDTASRTQSLQAACAQLIRTVRNQPGNSVQSSPSP